MKVLTIFAHPSHSSFCYAILEQFTKGLADGDTPDTLRDKYRPQDVLEQQRKVSACDVEHVFFYAVHGASDETRRSYLERAYSLGRGFNQSTAAVA